MFAITVFYWTCSNFEFLFKKVEEHNQLFVDLNCNINFMTSKHCWAVRCKVFYFILTGRQIITWWDPGTLRPVCGQPGHWLWGGSHQTWRVLRTWPLVKFSAIAQLYHPSLSSGLFLHVIGVYYLAREAKFFDF